ncbi:hypothetical protein K435DRAFT_818089 [Dendrothele bispora CBS 962.96]|uniref:Mediator complex subunit 9 n=1 Tax=Dendrothele bispora (strain CBS 962.96) TaxID=1314807 RepID=A0A4S8MFJ9_DENBC|nr:hypothetical protein K435DRAFT_818089 [Dendrothele bispora CBS 962.96]
MANMGTPTQYQAILLKLVTVLELTQRPEGISTPQARQALLQATNDFKTSLLQAKDMAANLPGGELLIEDQDDIIEMLITLRQRKRDQLAQFSAQAQAVSSAETKMEVDSTASTPFQD